MIDFQNVKNIITPKGEVSVIARGEEVLWRKQKYKRELLYLESNRRQWIDTGILATTTTDFEVTAAITETAQTAWIAGAPTWIGVHKKAGTVAIAQTYSGMTYNAVGVGEVFTIGVFGNKAYFNNVETNTLTRQNSKMTLFLFAYHHENDTGSIQSAVRMYSFKIWDNGTLIRDFIPVLDMDDVPCMYDKVSGNLFYNQGTEAFAYAEIYGLPSAYQEVAYLQSTGTQFIDTGYPFNSNTDTIEFDYACLETSQYKWIFGNYVGDYLGLSTHSYQTLWYGRTGVNLGFTEFNSERHKLVIDENGVSLDGTRRSSFKSFENSVNLYLFAMNYDGTLTTGYKGKAKVWGYRHSRNGALIRDFIPCYRKSDGEAGMYDLVSGTFFTNVGTDKFGYGAN